MTKEVRYDRICLILGIAGIVLGMSTLTVDGISLGIPCGIFGITCAILSNRANGEKTKQARIGMTLSIIALAFGMIFYGMTYITMKTMSDPVKSKEVINYIEQILPQMPEEYRELFNGYI